MKAEERTMMMTNTNKFLRQCSSDVSMFIEITQALFMVMLLVVVYLFIPVVGISIIAHPILPDDIHSRCMFCPPDYVSYMTTGAVVCVILMCIYAKIRHPQGATE